MTVLLQYRLMLYNCSCTIYLDNIHPQVHPTNATKQRVLLLKLNFFSKQMDNKHLAFSLFRIHQ